MGVPDRPPRLRRGRLDAAAAPLPPLGPAAGRLYVCGDHRDTGTVQGALVSGRRAAEAVLHDLGVRTGTAAAEEAA
nr:FAD-dependent oxidoreductase [Kitasatospora fiedleri]